MSNTLDKDLKGSRKNNPEAGLFTHYLSKDVFIINPDITRNIFNSVNKNRVYTNEWNSENENKANVIMKCSDYGFNVKTDYLDQDMNYLHLNMNEMFLLFGFIIQKFEETNKNKDYKDFNFEIETSWNEIVNTLNIRGTAKYLYKYQRAFELLRKTKLQIGRKVSGLISEYNNTWPEPKDPKNPSAVRLNKKEVITVTLPRNIVDFVKYHNRKILVSYEIFSKIESQVTKKLYVYLLGLSTTRRNQGLLFSGLKEVLGYKYSYENNGEIFKKELSDKKVRAAIKESAKELVELGFLIDSNCLHSGIEGLEKYKFFDQKNADYNKENGSKNEDGKESKDEDGIDSLNKDNLEDIPNL